MSAYWIGTSWKMNKSLAEARQYAAGLRQALLQRPELARGVQPFVIPPHTAISSVVEELGELANAPGGVRVGAQNAHWEDRGAWTGEVSVPQVLDAGAEIVEIGHSERREFFNETIRTTRLKVRAALEHAAMPLLCVGEPEEVRDRGSTTEYLLGQARGALSGLTAEALGRVIIAYEPVWAIGVSGRPARGEELEEPFSVLSEEFPEVQALLYGGSVSADYATELLALENVDGLFVGRAAWELEGYLELLRISSATSVTGTRKTAE